MKIEVGDRVKTLVKNAHLYPMAQFHYAGHTGTVVEITAPYADHMKYYYVSPDHPLSEIDKISGIPYYSTELTKLDEETN